MLHQAAITAATVTRPDCFVIAYGGNVISTRDRDGKVTLSKGDHLKESAKGAVADALSVLCHCPWMVKVVVSVIPRFRLTAEALAEFRTLSSMLADVAFSHGAAFIDVEALLSAGDPSASGTGVAPGDRLAKVTVAQNGPKLSVDWFRDDLVHLTDNGLLAIWREVDQIILACGRELPR